LFRRHPADARHGDAVATPHVLGTVRFGGAHQPGDSGRELVLRVPLEPLADQAAFVEQWSGVAPPRIERSGDVEIATDGSLLFGYAQVDEAGAGSLRAAARDAYASIFAALDRSTCVYPLRLWNYLARINTELDGLERYRHFNVGRQEAFLTAGRSAFAGAPAACAIGIERGPLTVYFVAAAEAPIPIENPRQVSAYHYPPEHGPRSPTFSRATLTRGPDPTLFISGTASVVGHRSEHIGDAAAQTSETFVNLRAVVDAANRTLPAPRFALERLAYTIYVREAVDYDRIRRQFLAEVGARSAASQQVVFLKGDICRAELLVEIEATGNAA
jgi:chorismate lyase/3-hydroxybenzoate synthase